jgi:hypothetical protein
MHIIRTLLLALTPARHANSRVARGGALFDGAIDIYEFERRMNELARTRMALYAWGVGR